MSRVIAWAAALLIVVAVGIAPSVRADQMPSPPGAKVTLLAEVHGNLFPETEEVKDGDVLTNPIKLKFKLEGMTVAKAGTMQPGTGHHHLFIDATLQPADYAKPIPMDEHHKHFGAGQMEAEITLPPGKHTLQLVLGDGAHIPHNPPVMTVPVTVIVQ